MKINFLLIGLARAEDDADNQTQPISAQSQDPERQLRAGKITC